jgi:hypothetical protein
LIREVSGGNSHSVCKISRIQQPLSGCRVNTTEAQGIFAQPKSVAIQPLTITPSQVDEVSVVLYCSQWCRSVGIKIGDIDPVIDLLHLSHTVLPGNTHGSYFCKARRLVFVGPHAKASLFARKDKPNVATATNRQ